MSKCSNNKSPEMPEFIETEFKGGSAPNKQQDNDIVAPENGIETKEQSMPSDDVQQSDDDEDKDDDDPQKNEEQENEDVWELVKIMSCADVSSDCPIKCSIESCPVPAAVAYVSNQKANEKWYGCLDCQVRT